MIRTPTGKIWIALALALLAGTGFGGEADRQEEGWNAGVVLGEEDLAERAEIARNLFRRITPGDDPLVQDVGTWPVAWEEFAPNWAAATVGREYGAWVVPFSLAQENGTTVIRDADDIVLWRGETDFAKPESASVTLIGGLVAEEDWAAYEGVRNWIESNARLDDTPSRGATYTNGLRFTSLAIDTNGTVELSLAWEEDGDVDIFAYLLSGIPSTNVVTWTNDENQVVTTTNTVWEIIGENLSGFDNAWEWRGMASVTNGEGIFTDSGAAANPVRMGFYAAAEANDTDGDGLNDGFESFVHHTDPENTDSDGDGEPDGTDPYPGTSNVFWVVKTTNNLFRQVGLGIYTNSPSIPRPVLTNLPVSGTAPTTDSVVLDICITGYVDDAIRVDANGVDWAQDTQRFYHRSITNEVSGLQSRQFNLELWDWPRDNFTNQANEVRLGWSTNEQFEVEWTWKVPVCVTGADFLCVGDIAQMGVSWPSGGPYSWSVMGSAASINASGLLTAITTGVATVTASNALGGTVSKDITVVQIDFLDASNAPLTALKIGKWENAFEMSGTNAVVKDDFIDLDPDRYRIRLVNPAQIGVGTETIWVSTDSDGTGHDDVFTGLDLTEEPANSGVFLSTNLLLMADNTDDGFSNTQVPDDTDWNDRTHKIALGGTLWAWYQTSEGTSCSNGLTVNVEGTCHVIPVILRNMAATNGGEPVVSIATVESAMEIACERYAQVGIKLTWDTPVVSDPPSGVNLSDGLTVRTNENTRWLAEEAKSAIAGVGTVDNLTDIHLIFVPSLYAGEVTPTGSSVAGYWYTNSVDQAYLFNAFLKNAPTLESFGAAIAHEIGHLLTNAGHAPNSCPWRLMYKKITSTDVTGQRRFVAAEETLIRGNDHVH